MFFLILFIFITLSFPPLKVKDENDSNVIDISNNINDLAKAYVNIMEKENVSLFYFKWTIRKI